MSKYLYLPQDVARLFRFSNFRHSDEKYVQDTLWEQRDTVLAPQYRKDKYRFVSEISRWLYQDESDVEADAQTINLVLQDLGSAYRIGSPEEDTQYIEAFFRFVKLRLTFVAECDDVRLKLRTLLEEFGYQRRSDRLLASIRRSMKALGLQGFLRDYEACDVGEISLDDMLMIRLAQQ